MPLVFDQVRSAVIRESRSPDGTSVFLQVIGQDSRAIQLEDNDLGQGRMPYRLEAGVSTNAVKVLERGSVQE
jgi:hypothetical protein